MSTRLNSCVMSNWEIDSANDWPPNNNGEPGMILGVGDAVGTGVGVGVRFGEGIGVSMTEVEA